MKGTATQMRKDRAMSRSVYSAPSLLAPARWIAVLRVVVGLWFIKSLFTKVTIALAWGFLPVPAANSRWLAVMPKLIEKYAADNPITWYHEFLINTVIPNAYLRPSDRAWRSRSRHFAHVRLPHRARLDWRTH